MSAALQREAEAPVRHRAVTHPVVRFQGEVVRLLAVHPGGPDEVHRPIHPIARLTNPAALALAAGCAWDTGDPRKGRLTPLGTLPPGGLRWAPPGVPCWTGWRDEHTALHEAAHHLAREAHAAGMDGLRVIFRVQHVRLAGVLLDVRGHGDRAPLGVDPRCWSLPQCIGERMARRLDLDGIFHRSARRAGREGVTVFRPGGLEVGRMGRSWEIRAGADGATARRIDTREAGR